MNYKWVQWAVLAAVSITLGSCAYLDGAAEAVESLGPAAQAGASALDWMMANGIIPEDVSQDLTKWFDATNQKVVDLNDRLGNTVTTTQAGYGAGSLVAGVLALVRMWRGGADKGIVADLKAAKAVKKAKA